MIKYPKRVNYWADRCLRMGGVMEVRSGDIARDRDVTG
jgi:hypothetical protein